MEILLQALALYVVPLIIAFVFGALVWVTMRAKREDVA